MQKLLLDHLLLAFLKADSFLVPLLEWKTKNYSKPEHIVKESLDDLKIENVKEVQFSQEVKDSLDYAYNLSSSNQHSYISVEHIFYALLNNVDSKIIDYFLACDIDVVELQDIVDEILNYDIISDPQILSQSSPGMSMGSSPTSSSNKTESYTVNLNDMAKEGKFSFLKPKECYVNKIEEVLCRKTKCCALLVGDAGVGKTALVEVFI